MADHTHEHADDGMVHVHVHPTKFYAAILGALLVLTVVTVAVSYVDIDGILALGREVEGVGAWNLTVAILIATMKASLVVLFFMHLKDDARFNALVFIGSVLFVGVFFAYTMNDTATRGKTGDRYNGVEIDPDTGIRAPGGIAGEIHGEELEAGLVAPAAEAAPVEAAPAAGAPADSTDSDAAETDAADSGEAAPPGDADEIPPETVPSEQEGAPSALAPAEMETAGEAAPLEEEAEEEEAAASAPAPRTARRRPAAGAASARATGAPAPPAAREDTPEPAAPAE